MTIYTIDFITSIRGRYVDVNIDDGDFVAFIKIYENMIREDDKCPLFSQTNKYDLFPKKKQYNRMRVGKNVWAPSIPVSDVDKMQKVIKSILNKITDKNYDILIETLICELNKFKIADILDLLVSEIIGKISTDVSYHGLYVKLCGRLFAMKHWHEQLITIVMDDDKLYWYKNTSSQENKLNGAYETEKDIREYTNRVINFRYCFLNALQQNFQQREQHMAENKKYIIGIVDFIGLMYRKKMLSEKIIHLCLLELTGLGGSGEGNPELFCHLWKAIDSGITIPIKTAFIAQYFTHIKNVMMKNAMPPRVEFILGDLIEKVL